MLSIPQASSTLGSTMPHPRISTHPVCLQKPHPFPPHKWHEMSISAEGSVKGKYDGRNRMRVSGPNSSRAKYKKRLFQICERYIFINIESFDLVEEAVCASGNGFVAVYAPRADDANGRFLRSHDASLHRRSVGAQQYVRRAKNEERVLHVAGRMVGCKIERGKHMPIVFDFRPVGDSEAKAGKYGNNFVSDERNGMTSADRRRNGRTAEIDCFGGCGTRVCGIAQSVYFSVAAFFSSLSFCPISFFCSLGTLRNSLKSEEMMPFLLKYLIRKASTSSFPVADSPAISFLGVLWFLTFLFYFDVCKGNDLFSKENVFPNLFFRLRAMRVAVCSFRQSARRRKMQPAFDLIEGGCNIFGKKRLTLTIKRNKIWRKQRISN